SVAARGTGEAALAGLVGPLAMVPGLLLDAVGAIGDAKALEVARAGGVATGKATIEGIREGVDAHSPSRAAIRIGMDLGAGMGVGMEASPDVGRGARTISANALGGLAGGRAFGAPANDGSSTT